VTGSLHGLVYLLPGLFWLTVTALIWRAVPPGAHTPPWARRYIVISTSQMALAGVGLLGLGAYLFWSLL
jgi:hypothetical protein